MVSYRLNVRALRIVFLAAVLTSCGGSSDESTFNPAGESARAVPAVESTPANREACAYYVQPKESGAFSQTVVFYNNLASGSSGSLSTAFRAAAGGAQEIAPYYDADQYPPDDVMGRFQEAIALVDALCGQVLSTGAVSATTVVDATSSASVEALRELHRTLCETLNSSCDSPLLDNDPSNDQSVLGSEASNEFVVPDVTLPFATERNQYWNANCPKNLRRNDVLPLVKCDRGEGVRRVQELLSIEADGLFGNDTFNALLVFQHGNGLEITGRVDEETWRALDPAQTGPGYDQNGDGLVTPDEFEG